MSNITGIQFYLKNQVRAWLTAQADSAEQNFHFVSGDHFVLEMIDRPYRCSFTVGEGVVSVKLYIRSELGMYDDHRGDLNLTAFADGSEPMIWGSDRIDDGEEMIRGFLKAANQLSAMISEENRTALFTDIVSEHEGVIVKRAEDALHFRRVSGKKRPSMMCYTLFDGEQLVRPYPDEVRNAWQQVPKDFATLLQEAEEGEEEAMELVALAYLRGDEGAGIACQPEKAGFWFGKLAEADDAVGQFQLGMLYLRGMGVDKNVECALHWLRKAEENDHSEAANNAQSCERILHLQPLADADDCVAMARLAEVYMNLGSNLEDGEDFFELSLSLAEKAAAENVPEAMWVLAESYNHGFGVTENTDRAVEYYRQGCDLGHAGCQHSMGCYYLQGDYLISDIEKGIELCMKSAEQGYGPAMLTMGNCYQFGDGVPSSMKTAVEWYEKYLENNDDSDVRDMVMHYKTISGLVDDSGMEVPFEMPPEEPFGGFSIFGDDPFSGGMFGSGMDFGGGETFGMQQNMFAEPPAYEASIPMFSDDLIWTRLRAEAGDESAIALLAALGEDISVEE